MNRLLFELPVARPSTEHECRQFSREEDNVIRGQQGSEYLDSIETMQYEVCGVHTSDDSKAAPMASTAKDVVKK